MIIRRKHSGSYAVIPNTVSNDENLKADTLGVLVYLLAKPEDWKVIVADLRRRFHIGRNRVYEIIRELEVAGYVQRFQNRAAHSRWGHTEYYVFDCPQAVTGDADIADEGDVAEGEPLPDPPLPQNGDTVKPQQITASPFTVYRQTASPKRGHILSTKSTNSLRGENSAKAGEVSPQEGFEEKETPLSQTEPPSTSKMIWTEGRDLLKTSTSKADDEIGNIIGKWLKRSSTKKDGKEKLLAMIRAAAKAGTLEPVAYIAKAVNDEFGALPQPKQFDTPTWQRNIIAAIKTKDWPQAWGPLPGKKGCLIPLELITDELTTALAGWKAAA